MTIKNILVPVDGTKATRSALEISFILAARLGAHVDVLHVKTDAKSVVPLLGEGMSGNMIEEMIEFAEKETNERFVTACEMFDTVIFDNKISVLEKPDGSGPSARWIQKVGHEEEYVAKLGRLADMIIVPLPGVDSHPSIAMMINAALFETGRLVLLVPPNMPKKFGERAGIGWNGSVQAARAMTASMPLVELAKSAIIMTAESLQMDLEEAEKLAESLGRRGLTVGTQILEDSKRPVGSELLKACHESGSDFLVMGAYTRSRLRQWVLGGVTSYILENSDLPVLMAR